MNEIVFIDFNGNSCVLNCDGKNLGIWPSGDWGNEITANQARDLAKVLNYWAANGELPDGEIDFDLERRDIAKEVASAPFTEY